MTEEITDAQLERLDEVINELDEPEQLPEDDAPEVQETAEEESDDGFEDAGEEGHQAKREEDGLTRNQRRAKTRYDKIYREKREAEEKAKTYEAKLRENEQQFIELSKQVEQFLSGSGQGSSSPQAGEPTKDVKALVWEALEEKERQNAQQEQQRRITSRIQKLADEWKPIYNKVSKTHPAVAGWFYNDYQGNMNAEKLEILEAAQEFDYPLESLYAAAADESFERLSLGGKIKLIAKANKKIAIKKSQTSKADNPIEAPAPGGARKLAALSNEELYKNLFG